MNTAEHMSRQRELELCRCAVESRLDDLIPPGTGSYAKLSDSMRYSLLMGGKRIRAVICIKFCEAAGGTQKDALDAACAIEMLHAYSLIHDDLPCMDNSDLRRGKPSNHIKYGEFTATLAGDALQAAAFESLLGSDLPAETIVNMAKTLARAAGIHGICGGQYLDLRCEAENISSGDLAEIHNMKTAALISAAARIGVMAAGGTLAQLEAAEKFALAIGLAFQVRDDMLDIASTAEALGKPVGSDAASSKNTYTAFFSLGECEKIIRRETELAIAALDGKFKHPEFLIFMAKILAKRAN